MPEPRTLPISAAHREFTVKVNGEAVSREHQLLAASIARQVNRLSSARLVYLDGDAATGGFPLSESDTFVPGATVEVLAGDGARPTAIFSGVVVKQSLKVRDTTAPQLVVECRHKAAVLSVGRKSATFADQRDSEVIERLLSAAGLRADVEQTPVTHAQLVQYRATDWDFLLTRAEANGRIVLTNSDTVEVKAPRFEVSPAVTLQFGATLLDFDAEIDARGQYAAVRAVTWDPAQQAVVERSAEDPVATVPGNLSADGLSGVAGLEHFDLRHAAVAADEAQAWADAAWLKSQLSRVSGRARCDGIATVGPGDLVEVAGVGARFSGTVFVTGVRHESDMVQGWKTHMQFGGVDTWACENRGMAAAPAGALLPGVHGLQIGVVTSNEDPDGEFRVRVRLPLVEAEGDGVWARVASLDAGTDRGLFIRPEIGDEVVLGFLDDDPRRPVMLGMLHSSAKASPIEGTDANHEKLFQTRSAMKLYFNDDTRVLRLETPAGNRVTLTEADKAITIVDQNGNTLEMTSDGIALTSSAAITIKAATELTLESGSGFAVKCGSTLTLEGSAGAELTSSASTTIRGGVVRIN